MSDNNMLSQEEIDALLNATGDDDNPSENVDLGHYLSAIEKDALGEIGNISFGSAATTLSTILNQKVDITTPSLSIVKNSEFADEFPHPHVAVFVNFTEGFQGSNVLVIKEQDAKVIADLMLGGDGINPSETIGEMELSAVQEAMNQMMGSASTSMSTIFNKRVDISPPAIDLMDAKEDKGTEKIPDNEVLIKVSFRLKVGELIDSNIMQLLPVDFSKDLVEQLLNPEGNEEVFNQSELQQDDSKSEVSAVKDSEARTAGAKVNERQRPQAPVNERKPNVQSAAFADFENEPDPASDHVHNLNMLYDIPLQVTVELGRTKRTVKDILNLSQGSVIELDKLAGEPVDIFINHKLVAKGEVVVIDENFGVRVTDIANTQDRIQKLT